MVSPHLLILTVLLVASNELNLNRTFCDQSGKIIQK